MKTIALFAAVAMLGMPVLADDALPTEGDIDVAFTWSAIDLATIPAVDGATTSVLQAHLVLTRGRSNKVPMMIMRRVAGSSAGSLGALPARASPLETARRKTSRRRSMSTCSVWNPASSHAH